MLKQKYAKSCGFCEEGGGIPIKCKNLIRLVEITEDSSPAWEYTCVHIAREVVRKGTHKACSVCYKRFLIDNIEIVKSIKLSPTIRHCLSCQV